MTSEQLRERAREAFKCDVCAGSGQVMFYGRNFGPCQKCKGACCDEANAEIAASFAASIRAETLEEAAKIAEKHYAPMQDHVNATCGLRSVGAQLAAAIRDAGKKE